MSHTPGPWIVGGESSNDAEAEFVCNADGSKTICWTADTYDEDEDKGVITDEDRANARLIAAAPALLAALKLAADFISGHNECLSVPSGSGDREWNEYCIGLLQDCKLAIAKAEGRGE